MLFFRISLKYSGVRAPVVLATHNRGEFVARVGYSLRRGSFGTKYKKLLLVRRIGTKALLHSTPFCY